MNDSMNKLIRITTVPETLKILLFRQLKYMASYYDITAISTEGEGLDMIKEQLGLKTVPVNMTRKITPFKDLIALKQLYTFLRRERPLIVHTHTPKAGLLGMLAAYFAGVPVRMHTVAGMPLLESRGLKRRMLEVLEKLTYGCATMVYPNSFKMKEIIISSRLCPASKLKVIGNGSSNGINTSYFDPGKIDRETDIRLRIKWGISSSDTVFCFIGRVVRDKGIKELVSAFLRISRERPDVKLLLVGPFEKHLDPLDESTELEIMNNPAIIWTGFQNDVRPYLSISDVFVFPSYREGFPNVVMQAGAMGIPSIVSNINGCNEIILDRKNGIIVPVKDEDALCEAMVLLLNNRQMRNNMASVSRQLIIDRYEEQAVWNALLAAYQQQEDVHGKAGKYTKSNFKTQKKKVTFT